MLALSLLAACGGAARNPLTAELTPRVAPVVGGERVRFFGDEASEELVAMARLRQAQAGRPGGADGALNALALSGGGADGAYGAGLLVGWTAAGTRPEFDVVTGVSAGALVAPFAFLGPAWDGRLQEAFTTVSTEDFITVNVLRPLRGGAAIGGNAPFRRLIARHLDERMLHAIAAEHRRGRRLLIGTTQLDAERPVVWDLGAIAASRDPGRLELARAILLASASIPGVFDPVILRLDLPEGRYDELHVDGSVTNSTFLYPLALELGDLGARGPRTATLYVIRNGKVTPDHEAVRPRLGDVAQRSLWTLTKNQAIGDLLRLHVAARRDGIAFRLAHIPEGFAAPSDELFDPAYMRALFAQGHAEARTGYGWRRTPPGLGP